MIKNESRVSLAFLLSFLSSVSVQLLEGEKRSKSERQEKCREKERKEYCWHFLIRSNPADHQIKICGSCCLLDWPCCYGRRGMYAAARCGAALLRVETAWIWIPPRHARIGMSLKLKSDLSLYVHHVTVIIAFRFQYLKYRTKHYYSFKPLTCHLRTPMYSSVKMPSYENVCVVLLTEFIYEKSSTLQIGSSAEHIFHGKKRERKEKKK